MSAQSYAEAGMRQPLLPSAKQESSANPGRTFAYAICSVPAMLLSLVLLVSFQLVYIAFIASLHMITGHIILSLGFDAYREFPLLDSAQIGVRSTFVLYPIAKTIIAVSSSVVRAYNNLEELNSPYARNAPHEEDRDPSPSVFFLSLHVLRHPGLASLFGGTVGAVGSIVLLKYGYTVMDPLHAVGAGFSGGAMVAPGIRYAETALARLVPQTAEAPLPAPRRGNEGTYRR
ncbi:hypothetical protein M408DRAFT_333976 [Serendipita vermifera MAFF 305830]|uniref:Uncharacterized protein n=1 Tax=Serendipita vermifera MAFF 305830 TaxID=933852 RepID=A0A0C2W1M8_SERVB|nr:hypothetical protein M408DRAFT_333976 [Serendipita vermifera MAFF 305830]